MLRAAARDKFINYCEVVDKKYRAQPFHEYLAFKLQEGYERMMNGHDVRLIIEEPPRHGKSELATVKFPTWVLGKSPEIPTLVCSYNEDLAQGFGLKARDTMQSGVYRRIFDTTIRADQKAKGRWITHQGGSFTSTGIGGSLTGRGFKLGIIDDPVKNRKEADSLTFRESVWDFYRSTFYTRQEGNSMIIIIATRWHMDDLIGRIEEQESLHLAGRDSEFADEWEYITFPAVATEDEEYEVYGKTFKRGKGGALWPTKFPLQKLYTIENEIGPYEFSALYQQKPVPSERQEFKDKWFRSWDPDEIKDLKLDYFTSCDPNNSEDEVEANDEWVVTTIGKARGKPEIYRIEESTGKGGPQGLISAIFRHVETWRPKSFSIETVNAKSLLYSIREEQRERERYFAITELKNNRSVPKETRIRGLIPLYAAKSVLHMPQDAVYEQQLLDFPKAKHDDRADCMANFLEILESIGHTDYDDDGQERPYTPQNLDPFPKGGRRIFA